MAVQHRDLPDSELHEPKGVSNAGQGQVYVADGAGSGGWQIPPLAAYGGMTITQNSTATAVTAAADSTLHTAGDFVKITAGWASAPNSKNISFSTDKLVVNKAGIYKVDTYLVLFGSTNNFQVGIRYALNGSVAAIGRTPQTRIPTTGDRYLLSGVGLTDSFDLGDEIDLYIAASATVDVTVEDCVLTLQLLESP